MFIAAAALNKRSLGTTNGLAQMVVAIQRTVGPAAVASLFAFSLASDVWELRICRAPRRCLCRSICGCTAAKVHVEAQRFQEKPAWMCTVYLRSAEQ